jgi:hypothetical protein
MNHRKISDRFNDLLELQRKRLLQQYSESSEITSQHIDLIIQHSYYLLNEVSRTQIDSIQNIQKKQKQIFALAKWISGLFVSILMALIIAIITKYVLGQ